MRIQTISFAAAAAALSACAAAPPPFDPASDPRVGAEVDRACYAGSGGGYVALGEHDGFVVGRPSDQQQYVLLLSPGCGDLRSPFSYPVINNLGSSCLERGELLEANRQNIGVTGGCAIARIFEWRGE